VENPSQEKEKRKKKRGLKSKCGCWRTDLKRMRRKGERDEIPSNNSKTPKPKYPPSLPLNRNVG